MNSLNELTQWHPRSLQKWLREIDETDLIMVIAHLPEAVTHIILENLSSRIRKLVTESIEENRYIPEKMIETAKDRILEVANDLIEMGELNEPGEEEESFELLKKTSLPPILSTEKINNLIETMALLNQYAQERGILALEESLGKIKDDFLKEGLQLIIDGTDPDLVEEILRNRVEAINYHRELTFDIIIDGILGIQEGNSNWTLKTRLQSHLPPEMGGEKSFY